MSDWPNRLRDLTDVDPTVTTDGALLGYQASSDKWIPGALELGYAQITSTFSTTSGTYVDVTGLTVTVTVGSRPIVVLASGPYIQQSTGGDFCSVQLYDVTGSAVLQEATCGASGVIFSPWVVWQRLTPAAGSRTYKLQVEALAGGTAYVAATAAAAAFIQVLQV